MQSLTMKLLCRALPVLIAPGLVADDGENLPHAFDAGWKGRKTCEVLYETPQVRVAKCTFPVGVGHEKHYHHPHFGYVLEGGTMRIIDATGERVAEVEAGGTFEVRERIVHQGLNVGDTTTSYLMIEPRSEAGGSP